LKIILHDEAKLEMRAAADHYESKREGGGDVFISAVVERGDLVAQRPGIAYRDPTAPADLDARRVLLRRHPYALIFVVQSTERWLLVAVAHNKREPGYWHDRISP
jgi:toxin ParE1/3/4